MIKATAIPQTLPFSVNVRNISEQSNAGRKRQPPCMRKLDTPPTGRNYLLLGFTFNLLGSSASLWNQFSLQVTPNGAVPRSGYLGLIYRHQQLRSAVLTLPADELLQLARYSGMSEKLNHTQVPLWCSQNWRCLHLLRLICSSFLNYEDTDNTCTWYAAGITSPPEKALQEGISNCSVQGLGRM